MKFIAKITALTLLISSSLFAQEPQRLDGKDSIINILNASTKGVRYVLNDTGINSELNEIGTSFFKNKYIILSNKKRRHYETTVNEKTNTPNNNLYCVDVKENGDLSFPLLFSSVLDSKDNEGSIAFSPDEKTVYYTQESAEKEGKLELYKATLDINSKDYWTDIKKVSLLPDGYSVETPSVSPDGKKIFFAANMPGGLGGYDLYEASINEDGTYGKPINLGPNVNTTEDEKFPNITADNKHLYFSSKGHMNIGGYDVFRSSIVDGKYLEALNLGVSLNSRRDDLAFVLVSEDKGYLSTDKSHSGNFDILKFEVKHLEKTAPTYTIVEQLSQVPLPNAKVIIKNEFGWLKTGEYILLILMTILIPAILYFFGTPGGRKERIFSTSVFITAGMFILSTLLFGVYVNTFSSYNELYGSIGALLILMLYIWVNSVILLLGFELNMILNGLKKEEQ